MFSDDNPYMNQVKLIFDVLPHVARETCFALKGGTAINLFVRDIPRLSVDIDLVYLPIEERNTSLEKIAQSLLNIKKETERVITDCQVGTSSIDKKGHIIKLLARRRGIQIKVEVSPTLRGTIFPSQDKDATPGVIKTFGLISMKLISYAELYAGKICAALDRQHPRDLFDIMLLLEEGDLSIEMWKAFIVYLISGNRPISELLAPHFREIEVIYKNDFMGMTVRPVELEDLLVTREQLIKLVRERLSDRDKQFLISFKKGEPDWSLLDLKNVEQLPAVQWKLLNIKKMDREKHLTALRNLEKVLRLCG